MIVPSIIAGEASTPFDGAKRGSCADVRQDHPQGVGRRGAVDKVRPGDRRVTDFDTSTAMYYTYVGRASDPKVYDRDGDGIACEPRLMRR